MSEPLRGEVWLASLDSLRGREQSGTRPVLVVSDDLLNQGASGLVIVLPITSTTKFIPSQIIITLPEGGLVNPSAIKCEAIRSLDKKERMVKRLGAVSLNTMARVEDALKFLLKL
jgi:mRNA interferase MazF